MKLTPNMLAVPGIGLAAVGLWLIHPSLSLIGVGTLLVFLGVWMQRSPDRSKQ